jgi:hypothetical protein
VGLKLNGIHQLLAYADDMKLLGGDIDTINKNMQILIDACKEVGLEVNTEKIKYMLLSRDQNAGQNRVIKIGNRSFENVSKFKYLGTTTTNQNLIQEEIKRRLNPLVMHATTRCRTFCPLVCCRNMYRLEYKTNSVALSPQANYTD